MKEKFKTIFKVIQYMLICNFLMALYYCGFLYPLNNIVINWGIVEYTGVFLTFIGMGMLFYKLVLHFESDK